MAAGSFRLCHSRKDWAFLTAAMGFTLVSDFFLVITHDYRFGVFTFCFAHMAYILRVSDDKVMSLMRIGAAMIGGGLVFIVVRPDPLIVFAVVYAALFVQNFFGHIKYYRNGILPIVNRRLMLAGIILFALCDIHVLMLNLPHFLPVPPEIGLWGGMWIWMFYAPSQILLSISAVRW